MSPSTGLARVFAEIGLAFAVAVGIGLHTFQHSRRVALLQARLAAVRATHQGAVAPEPSRRNAGAITQLIGRFGRVLAASGLLPAKTLTELEATLANAGLRGTGGLGLFIGSKVLLLILLGAAGLLAARHFAFQHIMAIVAPLGGALAGLLLPDYYLRRRRAQHLKKVEAGLPDALDLLVICGEAGLGLETAIERVAMEIGTAHPAVAEEYSITASDLRLMSDRRAALVNMGARTGLDALRRLAATLIQTAQFGTPLSQALRTLSTELRQETLTRFEERAARLPVFLTLPMIIFILPCVFIIVGGPAALQLFAVLGKK
jgi:tight adherence protein C